jgi:hypothetical protein
VDDLVTLLYAEGGPLTHRAADEIRLLRLQSEQFRFALMEARGVISKALLTNKVIEQK